MSERNNLILSGSILAAAAVVAYSMFASKEQSIEHQSGVNSELPTNMADKLGQLRVSVENTNRSLSQLGTHVETLTERVNNMESPTDEAYESSASVERPSNARVFGQQERSEDRAAVLESEFQEQQTDPAWSIDAKTKLDDMFQNPGSEYYASVDLANIECRSKSCKVDLAMQEGLEPEEFEFDFFVDASRQGFPRVRSSIDKTTGIRSYYLSEKAEHTPAYNEEINQLLDSLR